MTLDELKSSLTERLLAMLPLNMADDATRESSMKNLADAIAEPIDEAIIDVQSYDWKGMASVAEICTMQNPERGDVCGLTDSGTIVWPGKEPLAVEKGDIVVYDGSDWKMFLHIDPAVVDCYTKAETDEHIAAAVGAEATARETADEAIGNRIDGIEENYETKADAKSKAENYGIMLRPYGNHTLQFYRPSLA